MLLEGVLLRAPTYASDRLVTMNSAARIAVARESAVVAPRAPNTVPEAPAPKPAPASAPLPRCSSTSETIPIAQNSWMISRNVCSIAGPALMTARSGKNVQELLGFQRRTADQAAVDVGLGEQVAGVTRLDAAAIQNP